MEEESSSIPELQVDASAQASLRDTAKWTRFLAIISYVLMGLMVLFLVFMFMFKSSMSQAFSKSPDLSRLGDMGTNVLLSVIAFIVVFIIAVVAVVTYILMRFSTQTAKGIDQQNQVALERGIASLKTYMIINGVFAIIGIIGGLFQLLTFL
jgi:heme/copper-type cytochrome/quinol oxidase subunit 2